MMDIENFSNAQIEEAAKAFNAYEEQLLTTEEVCQILRIKKTKLYELLKNDEIPSFKLGTSRRFTKTGIKQYINQLSNQNKGVTQ